jgi:hypothetical protein
MRLPEPVVVGAQALLLGTLLFVAVLRWMQVASDAHPFRYQGF